MKRFALLLASVAFVTPALAADVIYEEPPAPAPVEMAPAYTWSGFYVGGQAGVAFNRDSGAFSSDNTSFNGGNDDSNSGFIGGGHVGYDYQMGNFVIGAVADLNYIDASSDTSYTLPTDNVGGTQTFRSDQDINYVGTVRAKAGYAMDRFMVYATGGLAYAEIDNNFAGGNSYSDGTNNYRVSSRTDNDNVGYAVGGGVDVLATQNVSFGLEYLYTDLGESKVNVNYTNIDGTGAGDFSTKSNTDLTYHSVMAKAAYHFN